VTNVQASHVSSHDEGPVVITGGAGFIGSNLAIRLARRGRRVVIIDSLARPGVERNASEMKQNWAENILLKQLDVREEEAARIVQQASAVVHFAAQVAVTTSIQHPMDDFDINVRGTLNLLEAARTSAVPPTFLFASTNKVYGDLADVALEPSSRAYEPSDARLREYGVNEARPLSFHTPYGCSKGAADQYVLDYARTLGVPAAVFRMSCIYGPRQLGTEDQGWVAHFLINALAGRPITVFGDGLQVRDVMFVDDTTEIYARAIENPAPVVGKAFNVGGGPSNAVSLVQVLDHIRELLGRPLKISYSQWRAGDQRYYVSDTRAVRSALDLKPTTNWKDGVAKLADWLKAAHKPKRKVELLAGDAR
jgi:CDP-paratose 2-epimerase